MTSLSIEQITALELPYLEAGEPSLGEAREALVERWQEGLRDRETALRLAFMEWYACSEPGELTGLPQADGTHSLFPAAIDLLLESVQQDDEVRFVLGWMAKEFPWCCGGSEPAWKHKGEQLWSEYLRASDLLPASFEDRGAYGNYFRHILMSHR